jgi:hypothetical protein
MLAGTPAFAGSTSVDVPTPRCTNHRLHGGSRTIEW